MMVSGVNSEASMLDGLIDMVPIRRVKMALAAVSITASNKARYWAGTSASEGSDDKGILTAATHHGLRPLTVIVRSAGVAVSAAVLGAAASLYSVYV